MKTASDGSIREVFQAFLKLGLTSFGGPVAHLAYFRRDLIERRRWLTEAQYAQLLAICQFLPGPASSQVSFSLGWIRAGIGGALVAFMCFTLPSALLLFSFAILLPELDGETGRAAIHGLKIVALAIVAQAVFAMSRQLCPDFPRQCMALLAAAFLLLVNSPSMQILVVVCGAVVGLVYCRQITPLANQNLPSPVSTVTGWICLLIFSLLLLATGASMLAGDPRVAAFSMFYRAGALVFGGGHVVLPLLEEAVVGGGWIAADEFLAGYGAAQAVPGPLFSFAAYLGALLPATQGGLLGAAVALLAVFLPGFLLLAVALPMWQKIAHRAHAVRAIAGVNASVVGLLGAALYNPVFTSAVKVPSDLAIALVAFLLLLGQRVSVVVAVLWCVIARVALQA